MGIGREYLNFWWKTGAPVYPPHNRFKMLELGDQLLDTTDIEQGLFSVVTGKEYFSFLGYDHTSVDLNGRHGSVSKDLTKPDDFFEWHNSFDIITNFGTTEHIDPLEAQWTTWKILHDIGTAGALYIHAIPDVRQRDIYGWWKGHCTIYYSLEFFQNLAVQNNYTIIGHQIIKGLCCVTYTKNTIDLFNPLLNHF